MMSLVSCHVSSSGVITIGMKRRPVRRRISVIAARVGRTSSKTTRFARSAARAFPEKYDRSAPMKRNGALIGSARRRDASARENRPRALRELLGRGLVLVVEVRELERHLHAALARRARGHRVHPAAEVVESAD